MLSTCANLGVGRATERSFEDGAPTQAAFRGGAATLYRRYPTRADLVAGAFEEKMWRFAQGLTS